MLCNTEIICEMYCTQSLIILDRLAHVFYLCVLYVLLCIDFVFTVCLCVASGETNKIINLESFISQFKKKTSGYILYCCC